MWGDGRYQDKGTGDSSRVGCVAERAEDTAEGTDAGCVSAKWCMSGCGSGGQLSVAPGPVAEQQQHRRGA